MCCDLTDCWQRLSLSRAKVEFTVITVLGKGHLFRRAVKEIVVKRVPTVN